MNDGAWVFVTEVHQVWTPACHECTWKDDDDGAAGGGDLAWNALEVKRDHDVDGSSSKKAVYGVDRDGEGDSVPVHAVDALECSEANATYDVDYLAARDGTPYYPH